MINLAATLRNIQAVCGPIRRDGVWGAETCRAIALHLGVPVVEDNPAPVIVPPVVIPPIEISGVSARSANVIASLHPKARPVFTAIWLETNRHLASQGYSMEWLSGLRSWDEQQRLYTAYLNGGPKAAPPGSSFHQFGLAADAGLFLGHAYLDERSDLCPPAKLERLYAEYGAIVTAHGCRWGGEFNDPPHCELHPPGWSDGMSENEVLASLRDMHSNGIDYFA